MEQIESFLSDNETHRGERVEVATLTIPHETIGGELIPCPQGEALLEASNAQFIQRIQDNAALHHEESEKNMDLVQAVVDIEKLSELIGITEDECLAGLHHEHEDEDVDDDEDDNTHLHGDDITTDPEGGSGRETDVSVISSGSKKAKTSAGVGESTPLVSNNLHRRAPTADSVALPTDLFVGNYLVDTESNESKAAPDDCDVATTTADDNHLQAFLLEVPQMPGHEDEKQQYVLALPEIQVSNDDEVSEMSHEFPMLERMLSNLPTLPTDIQEIHLETTTVQVYVETTPTGETTIVDSSKDGQASVHTATQFKLDLVVERKVPVVGYVILITGLLALSSVGAALDLQKGGVTACMKTYWRLQSTAIAIFPLALKSFHKDGLPDMSLQNISLYIGSSFCYALLSTTFEFALNMTSMANAFVLSNLTSLIIIACRVILGLPILCLEGTGAGVGFLGALICALDSSRRSLSKQSEMEKEDDNIALYGDIIAVVSSFGMAGYLVIAKYLRKSVDLFVFMFILMTLASFFILIVMVVIGETVTFSTHPVHGMFGWLHLTWDRLPLELYIAIVCNILGTIGYIAVMKYFEAVVISTVMLMEPVCGALMGAALGLDPLPDTQVWIGNLVVATGCFIVIYSGSRKTESYDATEALHPIERDGDGSCILSSASVTDKSRNTSKSNKSHMIIHPTYNNKAHPPTHSASAAATTNNDKGGNTNNGDSVSEITGSTKRSHIVFSNLRRGKKHNTGSSIGSRSGSRKQQHKLLFKSPKK